MHPPSMEFSISSLWALSILLLFCTPPLSAQTTSTNTTDFSCSSNQSESCNTYVIYRAQAPEYSNLGNISRLFGVSHLSVEKANNISSEEGQLVPDQLLLVPIPCGCTGNLSSSNILYQMKEGDSFYLVSIGAFENLTSFLAVESLNPMLIPTNLSIGQEVIFPLYCKCPTKTQLEQGINFLLTYVWQAGDDILELSRGMNSSADAILTTNNYRNFPAAVAHPSLAHPILIPVSELPVFPQLTKNSTSLVRKESVSGKVLITAGSVFALVLGVLLVYLFCNCCRNKTLVPAEPSLETIKFFRFLNPPKEENFCKAVQDKLLTKVSGCLDKPLVYKTEVIMEATMNLDERCRIGSSVYRATIDGEMFAVKQAKGDIAEEVMILHKVNHANLVKLMGVSAGTNGDFFLIYEFAEKGSLENWLHPKSLSSSSSGILLSWRHRLSIALDVANGLLYMHEHTRPIIVHREIRASNILLNTQFKAKISNFSMAKTATSAISPEVDVFAFGILLIELLSGRRSVETRGSGGEIAMPWKEIRMVLEADEGKEERLERWMDPNLEGLYPIDGALSLAAMARACTCERSSERPSMGEIVFNLSVLAHSCMAAFEKSWIFDLDENDKIINPIVAR